MPDTQQTEKANVSFNLRLTRSQYERFESLRRRMQERVSKNIRLTQKTVFLEALGALEAYYAKLEKDRKRDR